MISNVSSKLNGTEITTLPTALSYSLTYSDGVAIANNHLLSAGDKVTYKLKVAYRTDISASDLPDTETSLNFAFTITYVQADTNAITKPNPPTVFNMYGNSFMIGSPIPNGVTTYNNYNDVVTATGFPYFLKHTLDSNNEITASCVGFIIDNKVYYIQGAGATYNSSTNTYNDDSIYYVPNKEVLSDVCGNELNEFSYDETITAGCSKSGLQIYVFANGRIYVYDGSTSCDVSPNGESFCAGHG